MDLFFIGDIAKKSAPCIVHFYCAGNFYNASNGDDDEPKIYTLLIREHTAPTAAKSINSINLEIKF